MHRHPRRLLTCPFLVLMPLFLFPKSILQRIHGHGRRRRNGEEKQSAKKRRGRRRKLVEQNVLHMAIIAMMQIIDDGETTLVHGLRVHIDPENLTKIATLILGVPEVGQGHHQLVTGIHRHIGYLTTTLSNVKRRGNRIGTDGPLVLEGMNLAEGRGGGVNEGTRKSSFRLHAFDTHIIVYIPHTTKVSDEGDPICDLATGRSNAGQLERSRRMD